MNYEFDDIFKLILCLRIRDVILFRMECCLNSHLTANQMGGSLLEMHVKLPATGLVPACEKQQRPHYVIRPPMIISSRHPAFRSRGSA